MTINLLFFDYKFVLFIKNFIYKTVARRSGDNLRNIFIKYALFQGYVH